MNITASYFGRLLLAGGDGEPRERDAALRRVILAACCVQAAMESLVSGAICGITYHMFAGQPLTVIGSTGPVLVFETIVYKFCK